MGPLVPDIISNELNLVVALIIGVGFGYILEQAGFSSSRKLTGLFYGTDFTVLRVFFTAGATAMAGVLLLVKLGWLDAGIIFVNPTFLHAEILGGMIMGVGFVVGGYCPGTSVAGLAVGRVDALIFAVGSFLGVFAFGESFPRVRDFYMAGSMGDITVPAALGVSPGLVLFATVATALLAFAITGRIERRVNPASEVGRANVTRHRLAAAGLLTVGLAVAVMPTSRERLQAKAGDQLYRAAHPVEMMSADELVFRILDHDPALQVIDVREPAAFTKSSLPGALNIQRVELPTQASLRMLDRSDTVAVFVGDDETDGAVAATLARELGVARVAALEGGLRGLRATILEAAPPPDALTGPDRDAWAFRLEAAPRLAALIKAQGAVKPARPVAKKIVGGCGV